MTDVLEVILTSTDADLSVIGRLLFVNNHLSEQCTSEYTRRRIAQKYEYPQPHHTLQQMVVKISKVMLIEYTPRYRPPHHVPINPRARMMESYKHSTNKSTLDLGALRYLIDATMRLCIDALISCDASLILNPHPKALLEHNEVRASPFVAVEKFRGW